MGVHHVDLQAQHAAELAAEASRQRARLEGELHDGAQQLVIALGRELRALRKALPAQAPDSLGRAEALVADLDAELLRLRAGLMPPLLKHEGLAGALPPLVAQLSARHAYQATCEIGDFPRLPHALEEALYWLVQEAMNNAATHSQARHVAVRLAAEGGRGLIEVADDGTGCLPPDLAAPPAGPRGSGLHRLWLALDAAGARLAVDTAPGRGFRLRADVVLP